MARRLPRIAAGLAVFVGLFAVLAAVAETWTRVAAAAALGVVCAAAGVVRLWMPRAAHRAFRHGRLARAASLYRAQRALRPSSRVRGQLLVSLAACAVAGEELDRALALLGRADPERLDDAARAVWLNNRAYANSRLGVDLHGALADIDGALSLRPDVAGFRHTRGVVLLALNRLDEAIRELDAVWREQGEVDDHPLLEAERCYDLGVAWATKGEPEYAADYFARSRRAAPESGWGQRAAARAGGGVPAPLADLL